MDDYVQFIDQIKRKTGIDLSLYKEAQMKRRLTSLKNKRGFQTFTDYFNELNVNPELFAEFLDRMTINVSEFFRNPSRWEALSERILPEMTKGKRKIKVWSAACSTGEEPYSLSILLKRDYDHMSHDILATDLDEGILKRAKSGFYLERALKEVREADLKHSFIKEGAGYRVSDDTKRDIRFSKHNLLADRYEGDFDLIICRNVLIYFTEDAKNTVYEKFSNALKPGGVLFVGSTEQIFNPERFNFKMEESFFYRKQ
ncbi:protein-glutamate O-methyltransferase CheR [Bacillus shivajii]|uniref:CheR family methyltransferase n=1 Tax=Bacillus shivajii TaxID=1983719 RepID=UPI001CFA5562|nr:protein-glutamate O-methyltransferase CheR [Bacillus shivajii]UCZ54778.1 protein-glutamate O-methyltransferase CheR [Bacillus shivajii]